MAIWNPGCLSTNGISQFVIVRDVRDGKSEDEGGCLVGHSGFGWSSQAVMCLIWIQEEERAEELRFFPGGSSGQAAECNSTIKLSEAKMTRKPQGKTGSVMADSPMECQCVQTFFRFENIGKN